MKAQKLLTYLRKCCENYDLIQEGDRIAVALSGGKDSSVLLYGLKKLQNFYPRHFELTAVTINQGLEMDYAVLKSYCENLDVKFIEKKTDIFRIIFNERKEDSPCALCANMRRGALVAAALENGCNKIALGHHRDDYLSTALMSLIYEGRFYTFAPRTTYDDREIQIIRPLLYVPEAAIGNFVTENSIPIVKNRCPSDRKTKRQEMSDFLQEMNLRFPDFKDHLLHAVETSDIPDWVNARKDSGILS